MVPGGLKKQCGWMVGRGEQGGGASSVAGPIARKVVDSYLAVN